MSDVAKTYRWFDYKGEVMEAPESSVVDGRATSYNHWDLRTHWVFGGLSEAAVTQAITLCGRRAVEIPGRGEVDCPECIEAWMPRP